MKIELEILLTKLVDVVLKDGADGLQRHGGQRKHLTVLTRLLHHVLSIHLLLLQQE